MCTERDPGPGGRPPGLLGGARTAARAGALVAFLVSVMLLGSGATAHASPASTVPAPAAADAVRTADEDEQAEGSDDPLDVTIDDISAAAVPDDGPLVVSGTVTNDSLEEWRAVQVYGLFSPAPMTTSAELAEAAETPADTVIGQRITDDGLFAEVGDLDPGASRSFSVRLPPAQLPSAGQGVYWFGLQALGENDDGRDSVADGRARTFVPLVAPETDRTIDAALVVPVRHATRRDDDGRVSNLRSWADDLSPDGRLDRLLDFGAEASAAGAEVSWLLDPSVPASIAEIVAGNPGLSIDPTVEPGPDEDGSGGSAGPSPDGSDGPSDGGTDPDDGTDQSEEQGEGQADPPASPDQRRAAEAGSGWLERMRRVLPGGAVHALPYGDPDVDAVRRGDARLLERARLRSAETTSAQGLEDSRPVVAPPSGLLDPATLEVLPDADTVLLSDRALAEQPSEPTSTVDVQGRSVVVSSSAAAAGGPGPDDPLSTLAVRQRLVSEAALRLIGAGAAEPPPLVAPVPDDWAPSTDSGFFSALADLDWLDLVPLDTVPSEAGAPEADLEYPVEERAREVPAAAVAAAATAIRSAGVLQDVLPLNDGVADQAADEALNSLTYANRGAAFRARSGVARTERLVGRMLGEISVVAPTRLTPASDDGRFSVEVVNGLPQPVVVQLAAVTDGTLEVSAPDQVEVPALTGTTVRMNASSIQPGVSTIELQVTDSRGNPVGASDRVPVRPLPVSDVIWWILGLGSALLFAAIAVRLVRRVAAARRSVAAR